MTETDAERRAARAAILQRRGKLMACVVATGVATSACAKVCLSIREDEKGTGGTAVTSGGRGFCLTAPTGGSAFGGVGGVSVGGSAAAGSGGNGGDVATGEAGAPAAGAGGEPSGGEGGDARGGQGGDAPGGQGGTSG